MIQIPTELLKKILEKNKMVAGEEFETAAADARRMKQNLIDVLISRKAITFADYSRILSQHLGTSLANLADQTIEESVLRLLPEEIARQRKALVFQKDHTGILSVAMANPSDLASIQFLENKLKTKIRPFLATPEDLNKGFALYGRLSSEKFKQVIEENIRQSLRDGVAPEIPVVSITDNLISYAIACKASDIHLEILENEIVVRYRIDGILQEIVSMPKEIHPLIVARIKFLAALRLDQHTKPQDGRFRYNSSGELADIRVAIIPTFHGEKVEMRLLLSAGRSLSFEELGMLEKNMETLKNNIAKSHGIILITGPTGSGKSTTLYSMISHLNRPEVNITTIEDPVEYDIKYVNQTQVNEAAGISFANGLRALLRQDPDIMMVGEIRDVETAQISVQSALTGHLVLSSLHTNDAPSAIPRLIDMKIEPFLVAAVLNVVMAQRLVRKICQNCIGPHELSGELLSVAKAQMKSLGIEESRNFQKRFFKGNGCQACGKTGYKGRLAIFESFNVDEDVRSIIADRNFTLDGLRKILRSKGFLTMLEDGMQKAELGMTTAEEVLRVIRK